MADGKLEANDSLDNENMSSIKLMEVLFLSILLALTVNMHL